MNLIPGVDASEESAVLEQVAYQTALYLPLQDWKPDNLTSLGSIITRANENYAQFDAETSNSIRQNSKMPAGIMRLNSLLKVFALVFFSAGMN